MSITSLAIAAVTISNALLMRSDRDTKLAKPLVVASGDPAASRRAALNEVRRSPFTPGLLSALGAQSEREGHATEAKSLMTAAGRLGWRDPMTDIWLAQKFAISGDFHNAVNRIDALLRVDPDLGDRLYPVLAQLSADPEAADAIAADLGARPPWRTYFLTAVAHQAPPETLFALLSRLQKTKAPPLEVESELYVRKLVASKQFDRAYLAVMLLLPSQRLSEFSGLYNGNFDPVPGIPPFDWVLHSTAGASVALEPAPTRPAKRALHVIYNGILPTSLAEQLLVLPPGPYQLKGDISTETPEDAKYIAWTIRCVDSPNWLLNNAFVARAAWTGFSASFEVPSEGCPAQILDLRSQPGDRSTNADVWYDGLSIDRSESAQ